MIELKESIERPMEMSLYKVMPGIIFKWSVTGAIYMKTVKGMFHLKDLREIALTDKEQQGVIVNLMSIKDACIALKLTIAELKRLNEYWKHKLCPELTEPMNIKDVKL